MYCVCL